MKSKVPPDFNWEVYLELNLDVKNHPNFNSKTGAINHWILYGGNEGRRYKYNEDEKKITNAFKNEKIVIYTCISGNYDLIKDISVVTPAIDYVCFTDIENPTTNWTLKKIPDYLKELDNTRIARAIKTLPHHFLPEYDISIWIDGNIKVVGDMYSFLSQYFTDYDFCIPKHPLRKCIYEERNAIIELKKDNIETVDIQMEKYLNEKYPENFGLCQSNVIIRRHNKKEIIKFSEQWWNEILNHSKRDQLSFNYICWKNQNINIGILNPNIISSHYFRFWGHNGDDSVHYKVLPADYGNMINYINGKEV